MSFGTDSFIPWLQSILAPRQKYWYVPSSVKKRKIPSNNGGNKDEEEEIVDFIEVDDDVTVAYDSITNAKLACVHEKWPGLLELGPKKWKSFLMQKDARPQTILKNPKTFYPSSIQNRRSLCKPSKRTLYSFVGLLSLILIWYVLNDKFIGPVSLILILIGKLISPLLQIFFSFVMFVTTLTFFTISHCISSVLTFTISFTAIEVYHLFQDDVLILNIDHISLRKVGDE